MINGYQTMHPVKFMPKLFFSSFLALLGVLQTYAYIFAADEKFDSKGIKIHYTHAGTGEAVILLHGWMSDSNMWGKLDTNPTAKSFHLIAVDLRGHGKSDKPHDAEKYGPEMAEDVVRLMDHLKITKAHFVGYSMGAFVAGKIAGTHPERVLSVVYGGQAPILTSDAVKKDAREIELFAKAVEEGKDLSTYVMEMSISDPKLTIEQARQIAKVMYGKKDVKAYAAAGRGIKNLDVSIEQLKKCTAPIFFVHGSKEPNVTKMRIAEIIKQLGGEYKVIEGADHMSTVTNAEFGKSINDFLNAKKK